MEWYTGRPGATGAMDVSLGAPFACLVLGSYEPKEPWPADGHGFANVMQYVFSHAFSTQPTYFLHPANFLRYTRAVCFFFLQI